MITSENIALFESVYPLLVSITKSISTLSSKKPNDLISEFKLVQINKILNRCNSILGIHRPDTEFEEFNTDTLPQNSDALIMLELYIASMDKFKIINSNYIGDDWDANAPHYEWKIKKSK